MPKTKTDMKTNILNTVDFYMASSNNGTLRTLDN